MPFAKQFQDTYSAIKRAIKKCFKKAKVIRVDEVPGAVSILSEISQGIQISNLIICDLTDERPNVYYELGYAKALKKPIIIIAKYGTFIHINASFFKILFFSSYTELEDKLCAEIITLHS